MREEDRVLAVRRVGGIPVNSARRFSEIRARMTLTSGAVQSRSEADDLDTDFHSASNDEDDDECVPCPVAVSALLPSRTSSLPV